MSFRDGYQEAGGQEGGGGEEKMDIDMEIDQHDSDIDLDRTVDMNGSLISGVERGQHGQEEDDIATSGSGSTTTTDQSRRASVNGSRGGILENGMRMESRMGGNGNGNGIGMGVHVPAGESELGPSLDVGVTKSNDGEEMRKLMESIELTKKATILQQRLALAGLKSQRGWSELSLGEIEPKLPPPPASPTQPPFLPTTHSHTSTSISQSPIRRHRSRQNLTLAPHQRRLSHSSSSSTSVMSSTSIPSSPSRVGHFPYDPTAPPLPSSPTTLAAMSGARGFLHHPYASPTGGQHKRRPSSSSAAQGMSGIAGPSSPSRSVFGVGGGGGVGVGLGSPRGTPRQAGTPTSTSINDTDRSRRRSSTSTSTTMTTNGLRPGIGIDLSNHGFAHGREGGPRVVSITRKKMMDDDDDEREDADMANGRGEGGMGGEGEGEGQVPSPGHGHGSGIIMQRRLSGSLQSITLGNHRRVTSISSPSSSAGIHSQGQAGLRPEPTGLDHSASKKHRSQSHSTSYRPAGITSSAIATTTTAATDALDVDAANALTSMLGPSSPLRASFGARFDKSRSRTSSFVGMEGGNVPDRRMMGVEGRTASGSAIEEESSDEDKKAAELMIFLAHSPSPAKGKRRDTMEGSNNSIGRILFEDQLAEKQKTVVVQDEGFGRPLDDLTRGRGASLSATSSMDSTDQPVTPPPRHLEPTAAMLDEK